MTRRIIRTLLIVLSVTALPSCLMGDEEIPSIDFGERVPELQFRDIRGLDRSLSELGQHQAIVLVFTNTDCPLVRRTMPTLVRMHSELHSEGVCFVAVNTGPNDSIRDMAAQALEFDAPFYFVKDTDLSVTRTLGITKTPEVAVLNSQRELVYRGRINDQYRLGGARPRPTREDLKIALGEILAGLPVTVAETPVDGCLITTPPGFSGPDPTYAEDIAPLVNDHCVRCHQPGTAAPFSLLSYNDVATHAAMIARVIEDQTMPPWYAHPDHGEFQNDPSLTRTERRRFIHWATGQRLPGNLDESPEPPAAAESDWRIGPPDLVITMLEEHQIPATGFVDYRYSILPYIFLNDTWVEAVEIRPDNREVVHHSNLAYVTAGGAGKETFVTGYVPGGQPVDLARFESGVACKFPSGSGLGLQIHYTTTGRPERCRISVGLRFAKQVVRKQFRHFLLDPRFRIPPFDPAHAVSASTRLDRNATLLGLFTHMHVRGRDMTFMAIPPDGSTDVLLQIPNYNFDWQLGYEIPAGLKSYPAGTRIKAIAHFDNSSFNPYNPDPAREVRYGLQTVDEMFNGFGFYVDTDENLNLKVDPKTGYVISGAGE